MANIVEKPAPTGLLKGVQYLRYILNAGRYPFGEASVWSQSLCDRDARRTMTKGVLYPDLGSIATNYNKFAIEIVINFRCRSHSSRSRFQSHSHTNRIND
ncbi:MAG: hypothetical protein HC942_12810 [Microcoleus sp. SU_5_6]|nr:hypothetical protein [Microcoleus sp. SU_5_6]